MAVYLVCLCFPRFQPRFQFSTPKMKLICPVNCSRGSGGQWRKCFSPAYLGQIEHVLKRFSITHVLTVQCFTVCSTWSRQSCGMGSHIHLHPSSEGMLVPCSAKSIGHWSSSTLVVPLGVVASGLTSLSYRDGRAL